MQVKLKFLSQYLHYIHYSDRTLIKISLHKKVFIEVLNFEMSSWLRMGSGSEFQIVGAVNENDLQQIISSTLPMVLSGAS